MARILIGWELGANRGHAERLAQLGNLLRGEGHEVSFAMQRIDAFRPGEAEGATVWQAPVTPRLLAHGVRQVPGLPGSIGDILARLGMDDAELVAAMIRAWRHLFAATRPALVISEYAPFMLLAARGRVASMAVGTGFQTPPAHMPTFPKLIEGQPIADEAVALHAVNAALAATGTEPLTALPQLFAADRVVSQTFAELDPYAAQRREALTRPVSARFDATAGAGDEVFVYAPETVSPTAPLWRGLAEAGLPTRVHVPRPAPTLPESLARFGFTFEPEPLPMAAIAERSRMLVSHGGHGFVCAGLAAGLPHVVCYPDVEKFLYGTALVRLRLGGHVALAAIDPKPFAASLKRIFADEAMAERAKSAAQMFKSREQKPMEKAVAEAAAALL